MDASSYTDRLIDDLQDEVSRLRAVLEEISKFRPVTDSVDANSVSYASQLAHEALHGTKRNCDCNLPHGCPRCNPSRWISDYARTQPKA